MQAGSWDLASWCVGYLAVAVVKIRQPKTCRPTRYMFMRTCTLSEYLLCTLRGNFVGKVLSVAGATNNIHTPPRLQGQPKERILQTHLEKPMSLLGLPD